MENKDNSTDKLVKERREKADVIEAAKTPAVAIVEGMTSIFRGKNSKDTHREDMKPLYGEKSRDSISPSLARAIYKKAKQIS